MSDQDQAQDQTPDQTGEQAADQPATGAKAKAKAAPAPVEQPAAPAAEQQPAPEPSLDDVHAGLLTTLQALLLRAGLPGDVQPHVLSVDDAGSTGMLQIVAKDRTTARIAASALLNGGDGREYQFIGDGPGPNDEGAASYLRVTPLD